MARPDINELKLDARGQTAVEYIFLLAVVVTLITSLLSAIKTAYLGDLNKCKPGDTKLLCQINNFIGDRPFNEQKRFRHFPFKK